MYAFGVRIAEQQYKLMFDAEIRLCAS